MQKTNTGMPCAETVDEIENILMEADLQGSHVRAEIMCWEGEDFKPLNGWGAELIRYSEPDKADEVFAMGIGFVSKQAVQEALDAVGIQKQSSVE